MTATTTTATTTTTTKTAAATRTLVDLVVPAVEANFCPLQFPKFQSDGAACDHRVRVREGGAHARRVIRGWTVCDWATGGGVVRSLLLYGDSMSRSTKTTLNFFPMKCDQNSPSSSSIRHPPVPQPGPPVFVPLFSEIQCVISGAAALCARARIRRLPIR